MRRLLALILVALACVPATAAAQEVGAAATGLAQSPLYVDPSLRSALSEQERTDLEARLEKTSPPVLVALLPLVSGDAVDGKPRALLTVLRKRLGREDAILATVNDGYLTVSVPDEEDERLRAASTYANLVEHAYDERIATTLNRYLDALGDPDVIAKAEQARKDLDKRSNERLRNLPGAAGASGGFPTTLVVVIVAALVLLGSVLLVRRRGARPAPAGPLTLPDHVFRAAHGARRRELRQTVERELVELAAELDAEPVPSDATAQEHYQRALDSRDTARRLLADEDATNADLVGALVLEDLAQHALGEARAADRGAEIVPAAPLCALNPTHGRSAATGRWGSSPPLPVCTRCDRDLRGKRPPEVLDDEGRPYLERDTVWARTAFGALVDDLAAEVVRQRATRRR